MSTTTDEVKIKVGFQLDESGLSGLKKTLEDLSNVNLKKANPTANFTDYNKELMEVQTTATLVEEALERAFNPKLGTVNLETFNNELKKNNLSLETVQSTFAKAGSTGKAAFDSVCTSLMKVNVNAQKTKTILDKMAETLANTVKWNIASSAVNKLTGSVQEAWGYVKNLDSSLNDIRIVTQKSTEEMEKFTKTAQKSASALGSGTTDYTNAALTFYQQGLDDEEVEARANLTLKVANASGLDADDAAEYVTAVLNGYKVGSEEAEAAMDILAKVGEDTASSLDELSEAMSKTASTANTMGMSEEQLASSLATVIQVTRQDASSVGTAFKTILMRISDIEAGTEDAEVSLGTYTSQMAAMGVNVLDESNNLRDMGDVIEEVGNKWSSMSREQQVSLARVMAGTRQANNLLALFDNWDTYTDTLESANNSLGTLQREQDTYMERTEAHLQQLTTASEDLFDSLIDTQDVNGIIDGLTSVVSVTADWVDSLGGAKNILAALSGTAGRVFNEQIGQGVATIFNNSKNMKAQRAEIQNKMDLAKDNPENTQMQLQADYLSVSDALSKNDRELVESSLKKYQEQVEKLNAASQEIKENFADLGKEISASGNNDLFKSIQDFVSDPSVESSFTNIRDRINEINEALGKVSVEALEPLEDNFEDWITDPGTDGFDNIQAAIDDMENAQTQLSKLGVKTTEITESITEFKKAFSTGDDIAMESALQKIISAFGGISTVTIEAENSLESFSATERDVASNTAFMQNTVKSLLDDVKGVQKFASSLSQFSGSLTQLISGMSTLANVKSIFSDEDLSNGEKFEQTLMNLTVTVPLVISGFSSMITSVKSLKEGFIGLKVVQTAMETTGMSAVGVFGIFSLKILAVVAAIAALVAIIKAIYNWLNRYSNAVEEATQRLSDMEDQLSSVSSAAKELKTNLSDYSKAREEFKSLETTADDYQEKLESLNEQAKELIETLNLVAGVDWEYDKDGSINIKQKSIDSANEKAEQGEKTQKRAVSLATIDKAKTKQKEAVADAGWSSSDGLRSNQAMVEGLSSLSDDFISALQSLVYDEKTQTYQGEYKGTQISGNSVDIINQLASLDNTNQTSFYTLEGIASNLSSILTLLGDSSDYSEGSSDIDSATQDWVASSIDTSGADFGDSITEDQVSSMVMGALKTSSAYQETQKALETDESGFSDDIKKVSQLARAARDSTNETIQKEYGSITTDEQAREKYAENRGLDADSEDVTKLSSSQIIEGLVNDVRSQIVQDEYGASLQEATDNIINAFNGLADKTSDSTMTTLSNVAASGTVTDSSITGLTSQLSLSDLLAGQSGQMDTETLLEGLGLNKESLETTLGTELGDALYTGFQNAVSTMSVGDLLGEQITNADSLAKVQNAVNDFYTQIQSGLQNGTIDESQLSGINDWVDEYNNKLIELGQANENCAQETLEYQEALSNLADANTQLEEAQDAASAQEELSGVIDDTTKKNLELAKAAQKTATAEVEQKKATLELSLACEDLADNSDFSADELKAYAKQLKNVSGNADKTATQLADAAEEQARFDKGVNSYLDNADDWKDALDLGGVIDADTYNDIADAYANIFNVDADSLSAGFVTSADNLALLDTVCSGTEEDAIAAYNELVNLSNLSTLEDLGMSATEAQSTLDALSGTFSALGDEFTQGMSLDGVDTTAFVESLNNLIATTGISADTVADLLTGMGYDVTTTTDEDTVTTTSDAPPGYEATAVPAESPFSYTNPLTGAVTSGSNKFGGFTVKEVPAESITTTQTTAATAIGIETVSGQGYGGQVSKIKNSSARKAGQASKSGKSGSSKGSGGGSGSSSKPKSKDLKDETVDRYHDINIEIKKLSTDFERLADAQERLTGKDLIKNLNKQLEILEKQKKAYHEKIELAQQEASELRSQLSSYGASFNSDGQFSNYVSFMQGALNDLNNTITWYNGLSADAQEDADDQVEAAEKRYDKIKELAENYDELINETLPELEDDITEALTSEIELQITKFDMAVELRLDMQSAAKDWNEFKRRVIEDFDDDNVVGQAIQNFDDILSYYNTANKGTGSIQALTSKQNSVIEEINKLRNGGHSSVYSAYDSESGTWVDDMQSALDDLTDTYEELMTELEDIEDLEDDLLDNYLDSIDNVNEALENQKENYELIADQIDHDISLIETLYGDDAYEQMDEYYTKQLSHVQAQLSAQQEVAAYWLDLMQKEQEALAQGMGNQEVLDKYEENWKSALSDINSYIEEWADTLTEKYENAIDLMIQKLNNSITNGSGLDYVETQLDLMNENADNYLDSINAAYEKQSLVNKWQDAIDDASSITTQERLTQLMQEQMEMLDEKGQLTQYDVDRAEKEYEIALKQVALEEAQQNKSKMRLKRDSQGNYSYQFVSDEDEIRQAQQDLAEAQNALYNFDKDAYQENLDNIYSVWNEFQEKIADAYKTYADDQDALTEHVALLQEEYGERINALTEENLTIRDNLTNSAFMELANYYDEDLANLESMTEEEKNLIMEELIPTWTSGVQQMADTLSGEGGFESVCQETFDKLHELNQNYVDEMIEIADTNKKVSDEAEEQAEKLIDENTQLIDTAKQEYEALGDIISQVETLTEKYREAKEEAVAAMKAAYDLIQQQKDEDAKAAEEEERKRQEEAAKQAQEAANNSSSSSGGSSSDSGSSVSRTGTEAQGVAAAIWYLSNKGGWGDDPTRTSRLTEKGFSRSEVQSYINSKNFGSFAGQRDLLRQNYSYSSFDTGGYTGTWGNDGRLALLHQKELVLNKTDTENMLSAVEVLRDLVSSMSNTMFSNIENAVSSIRSSNINSVDSNELNQNVYITAQFEGQTEAAQIETALRNLVNTASQRAYNNNKR